MKKQIKLIAIVFMCMCLVLVPLTGCSQQTVEEETATDDSIVTIEMSDEAKAMEARMIEDNERGVLEKGTIETVLMAFDGRTEQVLPEYEFTNELDKETCDGCDVYTLSHDGYENVVLYIHGGAWTFEITEEHVSFCDELSTRLNAKVYMPLYPLSPQANCDETYAMIEEMYNQVKGEDKPVYVMGDSAGGEISLGLMHIIKEKGLEYPEKLVLISPCSDMSMSNEEIAEIKDSDPILVPYGAKKCATIWANGRDLKDPLLSAVYADVTGYPDTLIFAGTKDILTPDNFILYDNMKKAGNNVILVKGEGLWHVFPIDYIPEKEESLEIIEKFCAE